MNNKQNFLACFIIIIFYCALIPGCSGSRTSTLSQVHAKSIEYNHKGMKAAEKGDYEKALDYYAKALKVNQSIENVEGIAIGLINLSVLYEKIGDTSKAHDLVDSALSVPDISDSVKSEALYEKARLCLKDKEIAKAEEWANRSLLLNKGLREGSRWNLLAKAFITEGRYEEAFNAVSAALRLNRENNQRTEEANSLRLLAEINAKKGRFEESKGFYIKALDIDKELGDSRKIAITLIGLGELYFRNGDYDNAIDFYIRAYNVSRSADDTAGTSQAAEFISDAYKKSGHDKKAEEILKDHETKK
ncbi:MAG: tetratricopeptide repeat protein [Nitrospirae bacterium]|nr:tetratricopeptide repeat protein [Nitrospirota bacterium]